MLRALSGAVLLLLSLPVCAKCVRVPMEVVGHIADERGASIEGATVRVTWIEVKEFRQTAEASSDAGGRYEVKFMPFLEDRISGRESRDAAQAVLCAVDQNKGWEMHATLFANQPITGEENIGNYSKDRLKQMAATIQGLDTAAFNACIDSNKHEQTVLTIRREGEGRGVQSTPTFFVNNQPFPGVKDVNDFKQMFAQVAPNL